MSHDDISSFPSSYHRYFRNFTEDDVKWLEAHESNTLPFVVPELGVHYKEQWLKEDGLAYATEWDGRPLLAHPTTKNASPGTSVTASNTTAGAGGAASSTGANASPSNIGSSNSTRKDAVAAALLENKDYQELDGTVYAGDIYFGPLVKPKKQTSTC